MAPLNRMLSKSCIHLSAVEFANMNFLANFGSREHLSDSLHASSIHLFPLSLRLGLCCTDLVLTASPCSAEFLNNSRKLAQNSLLLGKFQWWYLTLNASWYSRYRELVLKFLEFICLIKICHSFPGSDDVLYDSISLGNAYSRTQGFWKGNVFWG